MNSPNSSSAGSCISTSTIRSQVDSVKTCDELAKLRALTITLSDALATALFRLEEAGLAHRDLRAPLQLAAHISSDAALGEELSEKAVEVGPYIFGTVKDLPLFEGRARFIFDCATDRVERLQVESENGWTGVEPVLAEGFRTWLMEENDDMIDHPENWDLEKSNFLPHWHVSQV